MPPSDPVPSRFIASRPAAANAVLLLVASTFFLAALALRPPEAGADGGADTPAILAGDRAVSASSAKCSTI